MSHKLQDAVWEHSRSKGVDRLVLLCVAEHANDRNGLTFPSLGRIVARTGLAERQVRYALRRLEVLGELVTVVGGGKLANNYRIVLRGAPHAPLPGHHMPPSPAPHAPVSRNTTGNEEPVVAEVEMTCDRCGHQGIARTTEWRAHVEACDYEDLQEALRRPSGRGLR